ncbi:MAG: hypothetical protein CM15mV36_1830 [Caudoviricetes sp.]|nr:MAG: hypothetical protein CM15mV36_1830 [Caudoviricetes sp.]
MQTVEGILNEPQVNFVGKDGFFWWVGEVEDNEDPMELGRCKVRVLGYYTNVRGGTVADLPTDNLPWATVLQHACQAGNDGQGESAGQLQPGAIVMGFFMDGESAQMPIVIGVLRIQKGKSKKHNFTLTGEDMEDGSPGTVNPALRRTADPNSIDINNKENASGSNAVKLPGSEVSPEPAGPGSPNNVGVHLPGSAGNTAKPRSPSKPIATANGVGGPWKSVESKLNYLIEDVADTAGTLVATEDGNFIDIVSGKVVTIEKLTAKLQNFLGAIFSQIVSAIREATSQLAEKVGGALDFSKLAPGVPFAQMEVITQAVTQILSSLCIFDSEITNFIQDPVSAIQSGIESLLSGAISKAQMVMQGVQDTIDSIVCSVQKVLDQLKSVINTVKSATSAVAGVDEIISSWEKGTGIFDGGSDMFQNGLSGLAGLLALFVKFIGGGCDRKPDGGKDNHGYFPLFGVTNCSDEELEAINKIRGSNRGSCNSSGGGSEAANGILDQIFTKADPYLQVAKTFVDGGYDHHVGTPGRQAHVVKEPSGTTHSSYNINNNTFAEWTYKKQVKSQNPDISDEELAKKTEEYKKANRGGSKDDTGNLVADHSAYAGNHTVDVMGDDCATVDGDKVVNVEGDYRLKVTGDCHIEVGGGFFFAAEGAPKTVDRNGKKKSEKIQKHQITFASDVDIKTAGAKMELQAAEFGFGAPNMKFTGSTFENSYKVQKMTGNEIIATGNSVINILTPVLNQMINTEATSMVAAPGIYTLCHGNITTTQNPSKTIPYPYNKLLNPTGPVSMTCGLTGYNQQVLEGAHNVNVVKGVINMTALKGAVSVTATKGAMSLTAGGVMKLTAKTIFLN